VLTHKNHDTKKVLVIGRHPDLLAKITVMLNQQGYQTIGKLSNDEAMLAFKSEIIDAVVIGGGVDEESRTLFHQEFKKINPKVKIIDAHPLTILIELEKAFLT
jgi:DNA-binding NtrC family response regulator